MKERPEIPLGLPNWGTRINDEFRWVGTQIGRIWAYLLVMILWNTVLTYLVFR